MGVSADSEYSVTLERGTDGSYLGWVDELPGCAARAPDRDGVLEKLRHEIPVFLRWAGLAQPDSVQIRVSDEVDSAIETDEDTEVLVEQDHAPLTVADWERIHDWLGRSRRELTELLEELPDDVLNARRPESERTVREEIEHVAFVELMYVAWTFDLRSRSGLGEFLAWTRNVAATRMAVLAECQSEGLTTADGAGAPRPEPWTARKAARRLLWHELLHVRALARGRS